MLFIYIIDRQKSYEKTTVKLNNNNNKILLKYIIDIFYLYY